MFGWDHGYQFWWVCPVFIFIMVVACIFMIRGCCSRMWGWRTDRRLSGDSAIEILKKRYALGEINGEEYEDMKQKISRDSKE